MILLELYAQVLEANGYTVERHPRLGTREIVEPALESGQIDLVPEYKKQVAFFDFACQELIRQSEAKNLEGATLAYVQLTTGCVQCHKVMRDVKK